MTRCLAPDCQMGGLGCDNMTVVLVCLLQGETYEELANKCSRVFNSAHDDTLILSESSTSEAEDDCNEDNNPKSDSFQQHDAMLRDCNRPSSNLAMDSAVRDGEELTIA